MDRIPTAVICIENQPEIAAYLGVPETEVMERPGINRRVVAAPYAGALWPAMLQGATEWGTPNVGALFETAQNYRRTGRNAA